MTVKKSKYKTGWRWLLIKAAIAIALVLLLEKILGALINSSPLGTALSPFHNHYFSFSSYYLTDQGMGSDFTVDPSATTRFVIYFVLGYLVYAFINVFILLIPVLRKQAARVNAVLYAALVAGAFLLAFFFPTRITTIDTGKKEIRITTYSYLFIPATTHLPFAGISHIDCDISSEYDGYNKQYINYSVISATTKNGIKTPLGEMNAGSQKGTLTHKPLVAILNHNTELAATAVKLITLTIR
jgi:hypothetical protein